MRLCYTIFMAGSRRTDTERKRYNVTLDPKLVYAAKVEAAKQEISFSELVEQGVRAILPKQDPQK